MKLLQIVLAGSILSTALLGSGVKANDNLKSNEENIKVVYADEGTPIPQSQLKGTELEGKNVVIKNNQLYVEGRLIAEVAVFVAGILAGYLVDGIIIYNTGYSGGELVANGVKALKNLVARNSRITQAYFKSAKSTSVNSYKTSDGNECVLSSSGKTYICKYSVD